MERIKERVNYMAHRAYHHGHHLFHCPYLGAASMEMHGFYSHAALCLLVVTVAGILMGEEA